MIVLNLRCCDDHRFEGWFGSRADFESQQAGGHLLCPLCGLGGIEALPSPPRIARKAEAPAPMPADAPTAAWGAWQRLLAQSEDVGARFAEEARRIHYRESAARSIRGQATHAEVAELREDGIEVLLVPIAMDSKQH